ncbi:hypothetical protein ACPB9J_33705 [Streptomyces lavendulocolor]|uniref:hypothetical protein n=1 Tax=Streptomyces lavendulocolor TaxID=67316 RepID=UPI003C2BB5FF
MTDLHGWITQQVDRVEAEARARLIGAAVVLAPADGSRPLTGTVTAVEQTVDGLQYVIEQQAPAPTTGLADVQVAAAILRRCEADRRILARHRLNPDVTYEPACEGCGTYGYADLPSVDNLSDCPELLDLAHAHGITDDILASLDRPQPPERQPYTPRPERIWPTTLMTDVPPALRGPNWKANR